MGADILPPHHPQYADHMLSLNQSQYRNNLASTYHYQNQSQFVNYMSKDFSFTQETLAALSREQIVENNFSEEFDPLFTTFRPQNKNIYGKFRILCSNITNQKIQEYKMFFRNEKEFRTYLVSYFWRKTHSQLNNWPLVKTTNLRVYEQSKRMLQGGISGLIRSKCSSSKEIYCRTYVEDIPLRLYHIKDIPYPQNLYVMSQVLKGFQLIYENIGYIKPFEDLICITRKGVIKVWINSDLSKNFPNIENIDQNITLAKSQSKLVNQILDIVVNNTDSTGEPISFYVFLRQQHVNLQFITFQKALQIISKYQLQYKVQIPDVFNSIVEVLNQQQEEYDTYRTDMEHANQEKGQSSQPIRSQNRSGSGLFLDVPNSSSRLKINNNNNNQKSRISSRKQSSRKLQQKHKNKTQKTQSLRIGQHERNSLQQSISGAKSNIILSQSLPISRSMNHQPSSNQINGGSGVSKSNKEVSKLQYSKAQIQKKSNRGSCVQIERESERQSERSNGSSVMAMRQSQEGKDDGRRYLACKGATIVTEQMLGKDGSKRSVGQNEGYEGQVVFSGHKNFINSLHHQLASNQLPSLPNIPYTSQNSLKNPSLHYLTHPPFENPDPCSKIHSNNQLPLNNNRHLSEFMKNKKTDQKLYLERKYLDMVLLNEQEVIEPPDNNTIVIEIEATDEEVRQMIEIDRFIEAQVLKEEEERLKLSEMQPLRNQLLNQSQQLMNSSHHLNHTNQHPIKSPLNKSQQLPILSTLHKQIDQRLNQTTIPLPPGLNRQSCSHIYSRHQGYQQMTIPNMLTSRQKQLSNESGMYNQMHSSHHVVNLDHRLQDNYVLNSHIVQRLVLSNRQNLSRNSNVTKVAQLNELITVNEKQKIQGIVSPHSKSSINSHPNQHLSFQHSNIQIQIQPLSSSSRANHNSQNNITNHNDTSKVSQNNLPNIIASTSSNKVFVPISQHQLLVSNGRHQQQTSPALVSSTSIGNSILSPAVIKQVHFQSNVNTIVSSPLQSQVYHVHKVTFNTKSPQKVSYANIKSSKNVSLNQINYSQKQIMKNASHLGVLPLTLSNPGQSQRNQNLNRLSYRAQTMVSAYIYSQGGNTSSRKYCDHEDSSEYSKPSIVEYSYLRNPEYFSNAHHGLSNGEHQTSRAFESSMENYLQKIPSFPTELIQGQQTPLKNQRNFSRPQTNHHYSYNPVSYQAHMMDIIPIPEQTQEMFNNSRSLVNNDGNVGAQSNNSNSYGKQYFKDNNNDSVDQIVMVSSRREVSSSPNHYRETLGMNLGGSERDEAPYEANQQILNYRKQSYFISQEFSHGAEDPLKSQQSSNPHQKFKKNICPSFESMSGCSQRQNQPFSNKSYTGHSINNKQNKKSFLSGKEKENEHRLGVEQRVSDQSSNNEPAKSGYRVVESIEENRPNSTYQMNLEAMEKDADQVVNMQESSSVKVKGFNNTEKRQTANQLMNINQKKSQQGNPTYQKASQSPKNSQKPSPRGPRIFHKSPVTGRTMFMNNQNELLSEFIDQESQLESQVDYTYNSYDKWKEKSKVLDLGPSRFKEFDQKIEEEGDNMKKFNHVGFGEYPERHGNHKQLVKSSIEGTKLLSHQFSRRDNFNTVKKEPDCNEAHQAYDQSENQLSLETFSPEHRMKMNRIRASSEHKEEEIDEDILNDLREY